MALQYHPDVCRDGLKKEESTKMFVQVNEAYKTLSNPKLKEEYDSELFGLGNLRTSKWMEQMVELNRNESLNRITKAVRLCLESLILLLLKFDALYECYYHYNPTTN
ncbi:hypothetical protein KIW84_015748 [Lathyrus oleraceus]|uniref:J domain-containing protein n=1 Tax=Pisum sativum TaxID=3888 RepID=A0A9D5BRT3_PEA|nr:hypothetical protein KIW84_015748 [Pisum sativum]